MDMNALAVGTRERDGTLADDFAAYVEASQRQHKRLAFLLTGDLHAAEDLLQAAYAKVYPRWRTVRDHHSPDAYLRRVMVNQRTSWWRKSRGREVPSDDPAALSAGASDTSAHLESADGTDRLAQSLALLAALAELPERQRAAVVLRHWCDLSEAEVAETMGCSVGTVKSNTSRGLAALRRSLELNEGEQS